LQSVVDDKEQVNSLSTKDLRNLFKLRTGTPSDTHDKLKCERCRIIDDTADQEAIKVLPKQLGACLELLEIMMAHEDASIFLTPLKPEDHGVSSAEYDKAVKQPIDLGSIRAKLKADISTSSSYKSPSAFSKDVNRIFTNVMKIWEPGTPVADASRRLQSWWTEEWTNLVPRLMKIKADDEKIDNDTKGGRCSNEECGEITSAYVHNERGEDFQEQIGMPDEENMRHWSHHHNTDTVDDPVFRAAMRGYDSVSFVFGLEVTWSLIQQRQQEDEEKQAMLELECMQELEEVTCEDSTKKCTKKINTDPEDENDASSMCLSSKKVDIDQTSNPATPGTDDGTETDDDDEIWNLKYVYTVDEILSPTPRMCDSENCQYVACSLWESSRGEHINACLDCQEEDFGGWPMEPVRMEPDDEELKTVIHAKCTGKSISLVQEVRKDSSMDMTGGAECCDSSVVVVETTPSSTWSCRACTYENKKSFKKCKMCGGKKHE
jgi:hypothetical protein